MDQLSGSRQGFKELVHYPHMLRCLLDDLFAQMLSQLIAPVLRQRKQVNHLRIVRHRDLERMTTEVVAGSNGMRRLRAEH
jgi:hypothetical protein